MSTQDEKCREAFEDWFSDQWEYPKAVEKTNGHYTLMQAESSWVAWQAGWETSALEAKISAPKGCEG